MKRKLAVLLSVLMLLSQATVFAVAAEPVDAALVIPDRSSMSHEEWVDWIIENVEPTYVGTAQPENARSSWIYTSIQMTYYSNPYYAKTRVKFMTDNGEIADWDTAIFSATSPYPDLITYDPVTCYPVNDANYKLTYDFSMPTLGGVFYVSHIYNIYGDGDYAFWDVSSHEADAGIVID